MDRKFEITDAKGGAGLSIRVVTRATKTEIAGFNDEGILKIRLQAASAGEPEANTELIDFLANLLEVPKERIEVVAGEGGREKLVSIEGLSTTDVEAKLKDFAGE